MKFGETDRQRKWFTMVFGYVTERAYYLVPVNTILTQDTEQDAYSLAKIEENRRESKWNRKIHYIHILRKLHGRKHIYCFNHASDEITGYIEK